MNDELDLGENDSKISMRKFLLLGGGALLLMLLGGGLTFYTMDLLLGSDNGNDTGTNNREAESIYYQIEPSFIINFPDNPVARLLQVTIEVVGHSETAIDAVRQHEPMVKNNLIMLLGAQDPAELRSRKGKERLRDQVLEEIRKVLDEQTGQPHITQIYFTGFVMQ